MSEVDVQPSLISPSVDAPAAAALPTAGGLLRDARMAVGVHVESLAYSLKVPVAKIEALELDDVSAFPDITFMRALASSVCRILHVDSAPVLALMPQNTLHRLGSQNDNARPTFRDTSSGGSSPMRANGSSGWLAAAVVLLLIGAAAVAFLPQGWRLPGFSNTPSSSQGEATGVMSPESLSVDAAIPVQNSTSSVDVSPALEGAGAVALSELQPPTAAPEPQTQPSDTPRLSFSARGKTWVQVMDKSGKVLLERNLNKGDAVTVNEPGVLSVVIGSADVTDVREGANVRDISNSTRNNVARFEVFQ